MGYIQCQIFSPGRRDDSIYLQDYLTVPIKIRLGEFDVYYNATRGMVSSGSLE